ncbi:MAG: hypothetical protein GYB67_09070 [Chloroflexi bacterium]|nr:hypothetical protein [Chloroflexota bacterium]
MTFRARLFTTTGMILALLIAGGSLLLILADATNVASADPLYMLGDNFFAVSAALSLLLVVLLPPNTVTDAASTAEPHRWYRWLSPLVLLIVPGLTLLHTGLVLSRELLTATLIGVSTAVLLQTYALSPGVAPQHTPPKPRLTLIYIVLAAITIAAIALRIIAPGSTILTWIVAPLMIFVVPGLSVGKALLPPETGLFEQLAFAPPLSLSLHLIGILWLNWLSIPVSAAGVFSLAGIYTLIGLFGALRRYASAT